MNTSVSQLLAIGEVQTNAKGIAWALVAVGLFSLIYLSGRLTGGVASAVQIIWLRYIGGFIIVLFILGYRKIHWSAFSTRQLHVHFFRAAAGGGSCAAAIYAATHMSVVDATAIGLLDGLFTVLLGVFVLREMVSARHWMAAVTCLLGALIVVFGNGITFRLEGSISLPGCVALAGAALVAIESILIKTLVRSEDTLMVLFYVNFFGIVIFAFPGLWFWQDLASEHILIFLGLGLIAFVAQACNIRAFRISDVAVIGPVRYSLIIYGVLFGALFFGEKPGVTTYIGSVFILLSGLWLVTLVTRHEPVPGKKVKEVLTS